MAQVEPASHDQQADRKRNSRKDRAVNRCAYSADAPKHASKIPKQKGILHYSCPPPSPLTRGFGVSVSAMVFCLHVIRAVAGVLQWWPRCHAVIPNAAKRAVRIVGRMSIRIIVAVPVLRVPTTSTVRFLSHGLLPLLRHVSHQFSDSLTRLFFCACQFPLSNAPKKNAATRRIKTTPTISSTDW